MKTEKEQLANVVDPWKVSEQEKRLIAAQLANAVDLEEVSEEVANLSEVWDAIDVPVYCVVDEEGVNVAGAQVCRLAKDVWLWVDDSDGYSLLSTEEVAGLILIPEEVHTPLGWDEAGRVIEI